MPFIDIARAIFAYTAASTDELNIDEGDLLYVLEKGDDDWWKVKKKVQGDDDGPTGLVPRNYLEAVSLNMVPNADPSSVHVSHVVRLYCADRRGVVVCRRSCHRHL